MQENSSAAMAGEIFGMILFHFLLIFAIAWLVRKLFRVGPTWTNALWSCLVPLAILYLLSPVPPPGLEAPPRVLGNPFGVLLGTIAALLVTVRPWRRAKGD